MYYKLKSNILFRKYETYGYITDDRNYRYIKDEVIGERIVSDSGTVFLSNLSKQPKSINKICLEIQNIYPDIDINLIRNDAEDFFSELVSDGFICSGETVAECDNNDYFFSYKK
ncbi:PqqD family peptide modification chaperone [Escherichia coli]|uniref:PqqD family peptide modification chaperone n=1 Tax=Escherichia coli TaxID=562 RepID=UPI001FCF1523|nr:PqqD family peptide modification chaperone [Escherichia coli]